MRRQRDHLLRFSGEDHQADTIPGDGIDRVTDLLFGALESIGGGIFGQHRTGDIQHEDDLDPSLRHFAPDSSPAEVAERDDQQRQAADQQQPAEGLPAAGRLR